MRTARLLLVTLVALAAAAAALNTAPPTVRRGEGSVLFGRFATLSDHTDGNLVDRFTDDYASGWRRDGSKWSDIGAITDNSIFWATVNPSNGHIFIGGNFNDVNGVSLGGIAEYDGKTFLPLDGGLDGDVWCLVHNGTALFVSGDFTGPLSEKYRTYGGNSMRNIAIWMDGQWMPMPNGEGLDDTVQNIALAPDNANILYVGGVFDGTTGSGTDFIDQSVSNGATATGASRGSSFNASNVLTNRDGSDGPGKAWILPDAEADSIYISFNYDAQDVARIRVANTRYNGNGAEFISFSYSVSDLPGSFSALTVTYFDPVRRYYTICNPCRMPRDSSLPLVDFYVSATSMRVLGISVDSVLGKAGGLSSVEVFSRTKQMNLVNVPTGDSISRTGTWTIIDGSPPYAQATLASTRQTYTFKFKVTQAGAYAFNIDVPVCADTCPNDVRSTVYINDQQVAQANVVVTYGSSSDVMSPYTGYVPGNATIQITIRPNGNDGDVFAVIGGTLQKITRTTSGLKRLAYYDLTTIEGPKTVSVADAEITSGEVHVFGRESPDNANLVVGGSFFSIINGTTVAYLARLNTATNKLEAYAGNGVDGDVWGVSPLPDGTGFVVGGDGIEGTLDGQQTFTNPAIYYITNNTYKSMAGGTYDTVYTVFATETEILVGGSIENVYQKDDNDGLNAYGMVRYSLAEDKFYTEISGYDGMQIYNTVQDLYNPSILYFFGYSYYTTFAPVSNGLTQKQSDGTWRGFGPNTESNSYVLNDIPEIRAAAYYGDTWYFGGQFANYAFYDQHLSNLAMVNTTTGLWQSVDQGVNDVVYAMLVVGDKLYIGGEFDASSVPYTSDILEPLSGLAVWDGTNLSATAELLSAYNDDSAVVYALAEWNGNLIVAGSFSYAGSVIARNVALYSDGKFAALGLGTDETVSCAIVVDNRLVVGGLFNKAGGVFAKYIAIYDFNSNAWTPLLPNDAFPFDSPVTALAADGSINSLFIGGYFSANDGYGLAKFDGSNVNYFGMFTDGVVITRLQVADADNVPSNDMLSGGKVLVVYGHLPMYFADGSYYYTSVIFDGLNYFPETMAYDNINDDATYLYGYAEKPQSGGLLPWQIAITVVLVVLGTAAIVGGLVYFFYYRNRAGK